MKNSLKVVAGIVLIVVVSLFINKFTTEPFSYNEKSRDEQLVQYELELIRFQDSNVALGSDVEYSTVHKLEKMVIDLTANNNPVLAWFGFSAPEPNWDAIKSKAAMDQLITTILRSKQDQIADLINATKLAQERKGELTFALYYGDKVNILKKILSGEFENAIKNNTPLLFLKNSQRNLVDPDFTGVDENIKIAYFAFKKMMIK